MTASSRTKGPRATPAHKSSVQQDEPRELPDDLRERVIWMIDYHVGNNAGRYELLEADTGISARKWQNLYGRLQQPTTEMLAALAKRRPYLATWMLTGQAINEPQKDPTQDAGFYPPITRPGAHTRPADEIDQLMQAIGDLSENVRHQATAIGRAHDRLRQLIGDKQ